MIDIKQSLHELAIANSLPEHEFIDRETLAWIISTGHKLESINPDSLSINISENVLNLINRLTPRPQHYFKPIRYSSIHGVRHAMRVMIYTALLSDNVSSEEGIPLLIAAGIHDVRRMNDNEDLEHGQRAASFVSEYIAEYPEFCFKPQNINLMETVIAYHDVDIENIPEQSISEFGHQIRLIKTADAFDRFIQPHFKWWPQIDSLKPEYTNMLSFAFQLVVQSEMYFLDGVDSKDAVINAVSDLKQGRRI